MSKALMSFLDRFKVQPKYNTPDPEIRAASVQELGAGDEDAALLVALARDDEDARVRRAAAAHIDDVGVLGAIAGSDPDAGIRGEVLERLAGVAASGDSAATAVLALGALTDQKQIAAVAKTSPHESVRTDGVGRLTDVKSLSSVARNAADARTAALAAERVQDHAELLNIAARTDHKDAGVGALERAAAGAAVDRDTLDGIADRAKNKAVAKRARAMVQAIDDAAAARRAAIEQHQQRVAAAIARVEALAAPTTMPTMAGAGHQLEEAERAWSELLATADHEISAAERGRFSAAVAAARAVLEREARERAEQEARQAQIAAARSTRASLCELVEAVHGEDALDRIEGARSEGGGLPEGPEADVPEPVVKQLEGTCGRARARYENRQERARMNARLDELSREAEQDPAPG